MMRRDIGNAGRPVAPPHEVQPPEAAFIIGIALSAGGLEPLLSLVAQLPSDLPASVIVVQHMQGESHLPAILRRVTSLRVKFAEDGEMPRNATVYVGLPNRHLILTADRRLRVANAPPVRHMRPSADWLFDSMAASFANQRLVVVLSGRLSDGADGASSVRRAGGRIMVQDPTTCAYPSMPLATMHAADADWVLSPVQLGRTIRGLLGPLDGVKPHVGGAPAPTPSA